MAKAADDIKHETRRGEPPAFVEIVVSDVGPVSACAGRDQRGAKRVCLRSPIPTIEVSSTVRA